MCANSYIRTHPTFLLWHSLLILLVWHSAHRSLHTVDVLSFIDIGLRKYNVLCKKNAGCVMVVKFCGKLHIWVIKERPQVAGLQESAIIPSWGECHTQALHNIIYWLWLPRSGIKPGTFHQQGIFGDSFIPATWGRPFSTHINFQTKHHDSDPRAECINKSTKREVHKRNRG